MPASKSLHVVVTGASSGIGEALAREFASHGCRVTLVARRRELLERLAAEIGNGAHACPHDLSDPQRATAWIAEAEAANGPIDVLINNAGIENTGLAMEADIDQSLKVLNTNLVTPLLITRHVGPQMVARGQGVIVQVASLSAFGPPPKMAWYGASKAGFGAFSEALWAEMRKAGVHVLTVYPGPVVTPMGTAAWSTYGGRRGLLRLIPEGKPPALARMVWRAVQRRRRRVIYPRFYWLAWWFPWLNRRAVDAGTPL